MNLKTKQGYPSPKRPILRTIILLTCIVSITGCSSGFKTISPNLAKHPHNIETLGHVTGHACGSILFDLIPISENSRVENAYNNALSKRPGATGIINTTLDENWFWWYLGTTRCVTIEGEAIK